MPEIQNPDQDKFPAQQPSAENQVGMPFRGFLYTLDQIAYMMAVDEKVLKRIYIHYDKRSIGARQPDMMLARNIAPNGEKPDWRVAEKEVVRFLKRMGFKIYDRSWVVK